MLTLLEKLDDLIKTFGARQVAESLAEIANEKMTENPLDAVYTLAWDAAMDGFDKAARALEGI